MAPKLSLPARAARHYRRGYLGQVAPRPDAKAGRLAHAAWWRDKIAATVFKVSILSTAIMGIGKLALGIVGLAPFIVVNGLYGIGMGMARFFCLTTDEERDSIVNQWRRYRSIGVAIIIASALFTVYAIRLFTTSQQTVYNFYVALGIATITFIELGSAIYQSVTRLHDPSPLVHAAKLASLASALTAMTLVQIAVRQLGERETYGTTIDPTADGWGGLFFGCLAILVGLGMIIYSTYRLHHPDRPNPTIQLDIGAETSISTVPDLSSTAPCGTSTPTTESQMSPCQF